MSAAPRAGPAPPGGACPPCPPRPEGAGRPASAAQVALLAIVAALIVYHFARVLERLRAGREGFASPEKLKKARDVHDRAREVFEEGGGDAGYSEYKTRVPDADPVQYADVRRLFRAGKMSPHAVADVI